MERKMETIDQKQRKSGVGLISSGFLKAFCEKDLVPTLFEGFSQLLDRGWVSGENNDTIGFLRHARNHAAHLAWECRIDSARQRYALIKNLLTPVLPHTGILSTKDGETRTCTLLSSMRRAILPRFNFPIAVL